MKEEEKIQVIKEELEKAILAQARRDYSSRVIELWEGEIGRKEIPDPNGFGVIRGVCGDTMRIFLRVEKKEIRGASFETDGCVATIACGAAACLLAEGKAIDEVMAVSPALLLKEVGGLPPGHLHCAILAVNTLHSAVANYLCLSGEETEGQRP